MPKIKCIIVDDEPLALDILENYIRRIESLQLVGRCKNGIEAINFLQSNKVDLLFLDIQMPFLDGISLIRNLRIPPKVILTTAYREYALDGYELNVADYLLKPISFERFITAIDKVVPIVKGPLPSLIPEAAVAATQPFIYVKSDKKMMKVFYKDLLFIEAIKDFVKIKTRGKDIITNQTLSVLEDKLPENQFLRVHKSFIVNIDTINAFNAIEIEISGHHIPIGRAFRNHALKQLGM